uniref:EF-hand domain-containing protein n=1 Tax=Aegilops tauschii subsp. strangulata TaxID=200361 RepID=A0A453FLS9_AEGTS
SRRRREEGDRGWRLRGPPPPWAEEHQRIYTDWFVLADPDGDGRVTGANATKFLAMSGLSLADLKQVSEPSADTSRCHC